jgi:hypothetical protein
MTPFLLPDNRRQDAHYRALENKKICDIEPGAFGFEMICHRGDTHMIKLRNFWSNYGEDTLLLSVLMMVFMGLYLLAAYLFIYTF